jgi:hypothetical protein
MLAPRASNDRDRFGGPSPRRRVGIGRKLSRLGVGVNDSGVFGYRSPPWRRLLGCFMLGLCLPGENLSPVLRRSDDGGCSVISFLGASLWKTCDLLRLRFGLTGVGSCVAWLGF